MIKPKNLKSIQESYKTSDYQGKLNPYQDFLYRRAMYGLSVYSKEEIENMHGKKKYKILKTKKHARAVINIMKQEATNDFTNSFMLRLFPNSPLTKELVENYGNDTDKEYINTLSLESLGITKEVILERFKKEKVLPDNFDELEDY